MNLNMRFCFVLPRTTSKAIGGYKIVFEYANNLTNRGHNVSILFLNKNYLKNYQVPKFVKGLYFCLLNKIEPRWFKLDDNVKKVSDYEDSKTIDLYNHADVVVATAVKTAHYVVDNFKTKNKIYLIQGRETWSLSEEGTDMTYCLGMKNVVVSHWLKNIVDKISDKKSTLIQNPIDLNVYKVKMPIENRNRYSIGCLYNPNPCKGFDNAFKAILKIKEKYPKLEIRIFGAYDRPKFLPSWIRYYKNTTQEETVDIYNDVSIFLCSSIDEGYGLTGVEAMACGCVLCSTNYDAVYEYAEDGYNCLLSPVSNIDAQVKNVSRLIDDDKLRVRLAENAVISVNRFSCDRAIDKFLELIE